MASERGAANIRKFNAGREERNLALVQHELQLCRKRKLQFKSPGLLAAYLSDRTGIHRTTLGRNAHYRVLLTLYLRSQPGAVSIVDDATDDPQVLRAKLASAQAEVGNLREEVKRLTAQLSRVPTAGTGAAVPLDEVQFANVCALLSLVLTRGEVFAVDTESRTVVDLAARQSERVIAGPERAAPFVAWMARNHDLPFVKAIRRMKATAAAPVSNATSAHAVSRHQQPERK